MIEGLNIRDTFPLKYKLKMYCPIDKTLEIVTDTDNDAVPAVATLACSHVRGLSLPKPDSKLCGIEDVIAKTLEASRLFPHEDLWEPMTAPVNVEETKTAQELKNEQLEAEADSLLEKSGFGHLITDGIDVDQQLVNKLDSDPTKEYQFAGKRTEDNDGLYEGLTIFRPSETEWDEVR